MQITARRTLSCAGHRNRNQFAVPSGNSAAAPAHGLVEL
jgi:hypothetical protein